MEDMIPVGTLVRRRRQSLGIETQQQFADLVGLSADYVALIERGKARSLARARPRTIEGLARALEFDPAQFGIWTKKGVAPASAALLQAGAEGQSRQEDEALLAGLDPGAVAAAVLALRSHPALLHVLATQPGITRHRAAALVAVECAAGTHLSADVLIGFLGQIGHSHGP